MAVIWLERMWATFMELNISVDCWVSASAHSWNAQFSYYTVSLPELIAQTNMDHQSVNRLREELSKITNWLGKNPLLYFVSEYETPGPEYIEKARGS
jgi:hypothetical protein